MANDKRESEPKIGRTPIFTGKTALIRFTNPGQLESSSIWLAEKGPKTIRPFVSEEFFDSMFASPEQAKRAVVTMSSDELAPGGVFGDFEVLDEEYAVKEDGSMKPLQFSNAQVQKRYGQPIDPEAENNALASLDSMIGQMVGGNESQIPQDMGAMGAVPEEMVPPSPPEMGGDMMGIGGCGKKYDGKGGPATLRTYGTDTRYAEKENDYETKVRNLTILAGLAQPSGQDAPPEYFEKIKENDKLMGFYIGALAYGGYTEPEVYADMIRNYKMEKDPELAKTVIIHPETKKSLYITTEDGKKGQTYFESAIPATSSMKAYFSAAPGGSFIGRTALAGMTDDMFNLPPELKDQTDKVFKEEAEKLKIAHWDAYIEKLKADVVGGDALADLRYKEVVEEIEKRYGVRISDDAETALRQVEGLGKKAAAIGELGGRDYTKAMEVADRDFRKMADRAREEMKKEKTDQELSKIMASGSPEEISAYIAANPDKANLFRLPQDLINKYSMAQLRLDYPTLSDAELTDLRNMVMDDNGNRRSTLWANYYKEHYEVSSNLRAEQVENLSIRQAKAHKDWLDANGLEDELDFAGNKTGNYVPKGTNALRQKAGPTYDEFKEPLGGETPPATETPVPPTAPKAPPSVNIQKGGNNDPESVKQLQDWLVSIGKMEQSVVDTGYGSFGPKTQAALTEWQKENGIGDASSWGNWGPLSISKAATITPSAPIAPTGQNNAQKLADQQAIKNAAIDPNRATLSQIISRMNDASNQMYNPTTGETNWTAYQQYQDALSAYNVEKARQAEIEKKARAYTNATELTNFINTLGSEADKDIARRVGGSINVGPTTYSNLANNVVNLTPPPMPQNSYTPPPQQNTYVNPNANYFSGSSSAASNISSNLGGSSTPSSNTNTGTSWVKGTSGIEKWVNGKRVSTMDLKSAQLEGYKP